MELPETDSEDEMAPGWEERCTADGFVFYAHHGSKSTQWHHPRTNKKKRVTGELPFGWERQITEDGKVFFVDHINRKTTYTDPRLAFAIEESRSIHDLRQRFDASSTGIQVLHGRDLSGKVAIVTGANSGIGYETARSLAHHGCTVIFGCRDVAKAEKAINRLQSHRPSAICHALHLDLTSLHSVRTFAHTFALRFSVCDILILNAGTLASQHNLTEDGYETTFQVNHLSHLYLAILIAPRLTTTARIIFVSAEAHRFAKLNKNNITEEVLSPSHASSFIPIEAYCNSKLCNVLAALEMQRRFGDRGINCYAVHPGNAVYTGLTRNWWGYWLLHAIVRPFTKSLQQACATSVFCAASVDLAGFGGVYVSNCVPCPPSQAALDSVLASRLWVASVGMIEHVLGRRSFNLQHSTIEEGDMKKVGQFFNLQHLTDEHGETEKDGQSFIVRAEQGETERARQNFHMEHLTNDGMEADSFSLQNLTSEQGDREKVRQSFNPQYGTGEQEVKEGEMETLLHGNKQSFNLQHLTCKHGNIERTKDPFNLQHLTDKKGLRKEESEKSKAEKEEKEEIETEKGLQVEIRK